MSEVLYIYIYILKSPQKRNVVDAIVLHDSHLVVLIVFLWLKLLFFEYWPKTDDRRCSCIVVQRVKTISADLTRSLIAPVSSI